MKKNLQLALAIMLGLATTAVTAQDWTVDSETRYSSMSDDNNEVNNFGEQFMRMGVSWGDETVNVNASFNGYADLNNFDGQDPATFGIHEAYASSDVMGFATLSAGRMALEFGSGRIIGSNDWNNNGNTFDGVKVDINNDFADITVGFARYSDALEGFEDFSDNYMLINASKDMGNMSFDFTYGSAETEGTVEDGSTTAMGLEGSYELDMGATLSFAYYSATNKVDGSDDFDMGLTSIGASYEVMDGLTAMASYDMYDENGFWLPTSNVLGAGTGTGMRAVMMEGTNMSFGANYDMGDFSFGVNMNMFESEENAEGLLDDIIVTGDQTIEMEAMDFMASYSLNENASLGLMYSTNSISSNADGVEDIEMPDMMWMSLNVSF